MSDDKPRKGPKDLASLTEEERKLLEDESGLDLSNTCDLAKLKKQYDETREKIKKIERKAKRKLGLEDDPTE